MKDLRGCGLKLDTTEGSGGLNARPGARLQGIQKFQGLAHKMQGPRNMKTRPRVDSPKPQGLFRKIARPARGEGVWGRVARRIEIRWPGQIGLGGVGRRRHRCCRGRGSPACGQFGAAKGLGGWDLAGEQEHELVNSTGGLARPRFGQDIRVAVRVTGGGQGHSGEQFHREGEAKHYGVMSGGSLTVRQSS